MRIPTLGSCAAILLSACLATAQAHEAAHEPGTGQAPPNRVLGEISFPTTTRSAEAQAAFIQGMLLLHLFEYPFAQDQFRLAREIDPGFAMTYWGEAMTHNHPLWDQQDLEQARSVLAALGPTPEARQSMTASQKEKDWLASLDMLYGDGTKAQRDLTYMQYLRGMAERYPDDPEVRLFYALALMGVSSGVRDIPRYMESAAVSESVFCAHPQHPGAAHYLIHAVDDPVHAPLGLEAARALAVMAPDAGHAQHMTSHIFNALGMWDDVIKANEAATRVANSMLVERGLPPRHWGHYNFWLLYGLLQQGKQAQARELLRAAYDETVPAGIAPQDPLELDPDNSQLGSVVQMWARYMIETRGRDTQVAAWVFDPKDAWDPRLTLAYVRGMLGGRAGDAQSARQQLAEFQELAAGLRKILAAMDQPPATDLLYLDRLGVMEQELQSVTALAENHPDEAISLAREASRTEGGMPYSFGPPFVDWPSAELLGDVLARVGRNDEAVEAYQVQLQRSRLKALPVLGLLASETARGNQAGADYARQLLQQVRPGVPAQ